LDRLNNIPGEKTVGEVASSIGYSKDALPTRPLLTDVEKTTEWLNQQRMLGHSPSAVQVKKYFHVTEAIELGFANALDPNSLDTNVN
jgi:hypothetical protein